MIFAATFYALQPPSTNNKNNKELYNVTHKEQPEQLSSLPKSYKDYVAPILGAPLPGELGAAVLDAEQRAGLEPLPVPFGAMPFLADHQTDMERAERIRLAQRAQQGRESSVFFQITSQPEENPNSTNNSAQATLDSNPFAKLTNIDGLNGQLQNEPNDQQQKNDFLNSKPDKDIYNPYQLQSPISPYQVMAGTVISASLITGLNSDLPGRVIAQVTRNVYDSVNGKYLLIPQGTRLLGKYDSSISFGQQRALVVWQRLIFPDGTSVIIDNLPATDKAGFAGLSDEVDFHEWRLIKGIALSTLFSVGAEFAFKDESDLVQAIKGGSQNSINRAGQKIVERELDVQPTITIRPGYPLRVIVHKDIILKPITQTPSNFRSS
ncbi:MAG: conjugal transfer protein TrbI [Devosiaceae bacterium]|nr:conjugal transfer protein TrbI [Devosiaceae bacterium]